MPFEHDLFISYAHIDNQPLTAEQQGWVTRFHATLAAQLSMRLGSVARIWRDDKLRGNDVFADEIVQQFGRTALLVSVLSPRYMASDWCKRELSAFCAEAGRSGGLVAGNKGRVFKVVKTPVDDQTTLPPSVRDTKGYEFFTDCDGAPLELDPAYGLKYSEGYFRMVGILSWELAQLLKTLQMPAQDAANDAAPAALAAPSARAAAPAVLAALADERRPVVYLAECTADRREVRNMLEAELKLHGLRVLPDLALPRDDEAAYSAAVAGLLARCALSIHLVGGVYGAVPDGAGDKSVSVLQNELAAAQCRSGGLTRLIWLPDGTASAQPQQQAFIHRLLQDDDAQWGADLLTGDVEALKSAMHATLKKLEKPAAPAAPLPGPGDTDGAGGAGGAGGAADGATGNSRAPQVYLLCDARDRKATVPLRRWLKAHGAEVVLPAFEGGAAQVREANEQQVASCDAVLLFYGAGDEAWKRTTDNDLVKRRGLRGADAPPLFTWLANPASPDKDDLVDMAESGLIDGRSAPPVAPAALPDGLPDRLPDTLLQPLLAALAARSAGRRSAGAASARPAAPPVVQRVVPAAP